MSVHGVSPEEGLKITLRKFEKSKRDINDYIELFLVFSVAIKGKRKVTWDSIEAILLEAEIPEVLTGTVFVRITKAHAGIWYSTLVRKVFACRAYLEPLTPGGWVGYIVIGSDFEQAIHVDNCEVITKDEYLRLKFLEVDKRVQDFVHDVNTKGIDEDE